jgi:hypothetical protein
MRRCVLGILLFSLAARADGPPMVEVVTPADEYQPVALTRAAVAEAMASPGAEIRVVTEDEARAAARVRGVDIPEVSPESAGYGRPWFIIKLGIGLPTLIGADIEVYVHDRWTVEGGVGFGIAGLTFMGAVRWRPEATCWGCRGKNVFSIGFGLEGHAGFPSDQKVVAALLVASADAFYLHRFAEHFGWVIGLKAGLGVTSDIATAPDPYGYERPFGVEPAMVFLLYTGFQF